MKRIIDLSNAFSGLYLVEKINTKDIARKHCSFVHEKFELFISDDFFISSKLSPVRAGMEMKNGKVINYKIKTIDKKRIYFLNKIHNDGDVQFYGQANDIKQLIKNTN